VKKPGRLFVWPEESDVGEADGSIIRGGVGGGGASLPRNWRKSGHYTNSSGIWVTRGTKLVGKETPRAKGDVT